MLEKKFHYIGKFLDFTCNIKQPMYFSNILHHDYSIYLNYFCIINKVSFHTNKITIGKFSIHWKEI